MKAAGIDEIKEFFSSRLNLPDEKIEYFLKALMKSLKRELWNADNAIEKNEMEKLGKIAHTIKGTLLNSGLTRWAKLVREIEYAAKNGEERDYPHLLLQLKKGLSILLK